MKTIAYWSVEGMAKYPELAKVALRIYSIPSSSATSERAWSTYGLVHSKTRNRLKPETQNMLVFVYINSAILDKKDTHDYGNDEDFFDVLEKEQDDSEEALVVSIDE